MSSEVYQIVKKLNPALLETQLIIQCAPMIAGLKTSNLLKIDSSFEEEVNRLFEGLGFGCILLAHSGSKAVFFLYNRKMLKQHLACISCRKLLKTLGYDRPDQADLIASVQKKYESFTSGSGDFPHELGLLLGYPAEDVEGYLRDRGKNALYTGCWQVYANPEDKILLFESYEEAREKMARMAFRGMNLTQIIQQLHCA